MDLAVWNAFLLYKESATQARITPITHLKFRLQIIRDIVEKYGSELPPRRSPGRPLAVAGASRFTPGHFPMEIPPTEKKVNATKRCVVCSQKRDHRGKPVRRESRYMCKLCLVALCVVPCFEKYHTH